jgi:26S proteasome regulatory subunit T3
MVDENYAVVSSANDQFYVRVLSTLNREELKTNCSIALHKHSHSVVEILPPEADSTVNQLAIAEKPDVSYSVTRVVFSILKQKFLATIIT